ncbi:MAG: pyruvate dehydrogenase (acetyl-transferring), homodimeric type [Gammaproteobacteria bacterium]
MAKHLPFGDIDPIETQEWLDALESVFREEGPERATFLLGQLRQAAAADGLVAIPGATTHYVNTPTPQAAPFVGNSKLEAIIEAHTRWNAMMMVIKGGKVSSELGGHIASYGSSATLYEVGFNHFFKAPTADKGGDLVFFQGHSSPGIYARAFLEGRFTEEHLKAFRQEIAYEKGLSSYPHPYLMPEFWQFATVSMGLGPLQAIYQARFLKYLHHRGLMDTSGRKVWMFCGDGEMDEPESLGAINIAMRERLDNLVLVVNCNLQRLDGPVRGNGSIIQELEGVFRGAGWHAIKVIWGTEWEALIAKDQSGKLVQRLEAIVDGDYQNFAVKGGAYIRQKVFGDDPHLSALVADISDDALSALTFGGHDPKKVYAAYSQAMANEGTGRPTVILAKTVKGFGMGTVGEGQNTTHQQKKLAIDDMKRKRDRFQVPLTDEQVEALSFCALDPNSDAGHYLQERRKALGGFVPQRRVQSDERLAVPPLSAFKAQLEDTGDREISTTMAFVRILNTLMKDKVLGERIVPIIPDECRTFGMEGMFRQYGIYSILGQQYEPVDKGSVMYYKEDSKGQVLEEGLTEAGAFSSWIAAATSYSVNNYTMVPFYIYYSMFGFQRIGDLAWAAGDMQSRGFLLGATSGRTTLAGEGLQHQDGHQHVLAATIPNCLCYDPTFSYEVAVIIQEGLRRMVTEQENIYYYLSVLNENYYHPAMPEGVETGILKGIYRFRTGGNHGVRVQLLGSGSILREVIAAAELLEKQFNISADVWSVTSFVELAREGQAIERWNRLHPTETARVPYVTEQLAATEGPVVVATDYIRAHSEQIRPFVPRSYTVLGTDGYGRSDTRQQLRHFFEVDTKSVVVTALWALQQSGDITADIVANAIKTLGIDPEKPNPVTV